MKQLVIMIFSLILLGQSNAMLEDTTISMGEAPPLIKIIKKPTATDANVPGRWKSLINLQLFQSFKKYLVKMNNALPGLPKEQNTEFFRTVPGLSLFGYMFFFSTLRFIIPSYTSFNNAATTFDKEQYYITERFCTNPPSELIRVWLSVFCSLLGVSYAINLGDRYLDDPIPQLTDFIEHIKNNPAMLNNFPEELKEIQAAIARNLNNHDAQEGALLLYNTGTFFKKHYSPYWNEQTKILECRPYTSLWYTKNQDTFIFGCYIATIISLLFAVTYQGFLC